MRQIEIRQLKDHDFDLELADNESVSEGEMLAEYAAFIEESDLERAKENPRHCFEKALESLMRQRYEAMGMLIELGVERVSGNDAALILEEGIIPHDPILNLIDEIRGKFEEAVSDYANQLADSGLTFEGPIGEPLPSQGEQGEYNELLARFVVLSILGDQRENA